MYPEFTTKNGFPPCLRGSLLLPASEQLNGLPPCLRGSLLLPVVWLPVPLVLEGLL